MKAIFTSGPMRMIAILVIALLAAVNVAEAQLPDCASGTTMYLALVRQEGSLQADSTEIRAVSTTTGVIGNLVGGRRYWIRKRHPSTGDWYYGISALGVDMITNRFYAMTQMSDPFQKDIVTVDPVTATLTVIGTTPTSGPSLNNYHFVKLGISPNGWGYAIGVHRDSSTAASTMNPLIRFSTCGAIPSAGCATIQVLGYLPSTGNMYKWNLYNGDIVFDTYGNLFFLTVAYGRVAGIGRYYDARLFRIDESDLPTSSGSGTIPMTFVADYNTLDSTVVNGIALDDNGVMYLSTRRFAGVQTSPAGPTTPQLYNSPVTGTANLMPAFGPFTPNFTTSDLASCYFPTTILGMNSIQLQYRYESGKVNLKWQAKNSQQIAQFEIQRSNDGNNFETIGTIGSGPDGQLNNYAFSDPQNGYEKNKFYRIKQVMVAGMRYYSNVVNVNFNNKFNLIGNLGPNPFSTHLEAKVWMRGSGAVNARLIDQSGRVVYTRQFSGRSGDNKFTLDNLSSFTKGVYIVELAVQDEVIRQKVIKQ